MLPFSPAAPAASLATSAHRYQHFYPPVSFFHLSENPQAQAAGHVAHTSMVWCMLHGLQPPLHLFASSMHAAAIEAGEHHTLMQQQQAQQAAAHHAAPREGEAPTAVAPAAATAVPVAPAAKPVTASPPAAVVDTPTAVATAAAAPAVPTVGPHGAEYTREDLLALYRPSVPLPAALAHVQQTDEWLADCVSSTNLAPVCQYPADALQAALQDELARDASMTGVAEYAGEWWLPTYADITRAKGTGGRGGRGGARGGRGGRGGKGGRGGNAAAGSHHTTPTHSHKKKNAQQQQQASQQDAMDVDASSSPAAPAATPAGESRKSRKRPAPSTEPSPNGSLLSKKLYSESNISKLFVGPTPAPAASAAAASAPVPFVLPSTSTPPPSKSDAATPAATAASSTSTAPSSSARSEPAPLPSKGDVYSHSTADSDAHNSSVTSEIMRNIQMKLAATQAKP